MKYTKILTLSLISLLTIASASGYGFLTEKIIAGEVKIAEGQKQLAEGEQLLAKGKTRLRRGERTLSPINGVYNGIKHIPFMGITKEVPVSKQVFAVANNELAEKNQQVAQGKEKIKSGEEQLEAGKLELANGIELLGQTNKIRITCAIAAIFFAGVLIVLVFYWRQSLVTILRQIKSKS
jgi:hypothetical protein